jgi:hypothetical protein
MRKSVNLTPWPPGAVIHSPLKKGRSRAEIRKKKSARAPPLKAGGSAVVVEVELRRMRPQTDKVGLFLPLVADPRLQQVLRKDIALQ